MKDDLINPELFGNEAGEDEPLEVLNSYYLEKNEFKRFFSDNQRLFFVRSRKGVGKSALLKQTFYRRQLANCGELLIHLKASDLIALQEIKGDSPADLVYGWQQRLCSRVNMEIGATLNLALKDDAITLVESAEIAGFRGRNLVSTLLDRLRLKGVGVELERTRLAQSNSEAILSRIMNNSDAPVWIFIDDIDATFLNTEQERLKVSAFFSACRNLINSVNGLVIRASVRTDVWTILAQYDESLDKCEQYMLDLKWSTTETGRIIENKILSYYQRFYPENKFYKNLIARRDREKIYNLVFKEPFFWGGRSLEAFRPIHILSGGRPRWAAQLCKLAGKDAFNKDNYRITMGHIKAVLRDYGKARLADLYKEHRHQCQSLQEILETFSGGKAQFTTEELLDHLSKNVIQRIGMPQIDGESNVNGSLAIAHFIYRIGFIAVRDETRLVVGFVRYEDRPDLLTSTANLDDGMKWEIHPSYRDILHIRKLR